MEQQHRLVGVGVGPGDPELVTCKAVRLLGEADTVLVAEFSDGRDEADRTEASLRPHVGDRARIRRVEAGTDGPGGEAVSILAGAVLEEFAAGRTTVVLATLGDPSMYSPFHALAEHVRSAEPDVDVEIVPGITAMQTLAAASRTPLVEGTESLTLVPATAGLASFTDALEHSDTVVAYDGGRWLAAMSGELTRRGRLQGALLGSELGLPGETVTPLAEIPAGTRAVRLTTVLVPAARPSTDERRAGQ